MIPKPLFVTSPGRDSTEHDGQARFPAAELVLDHAFNEIPGMVASMLPALARNGIRTVEDLAGCATDDLLGWTERRGHEITRHAGIFGDMNISRKQCDAMILQARVRAGWIEATALTA